MMKKIVFLALLLIFLIAPELHAQNSSLATSTPRTAAPDQSSVSFTTVASGLNQPVVLTGAGDGSGRLFVAEHDGIIWVIRGDQRLEDPFLDLTNTVGHGSLEYGLLGLTFSPHYSSDRRLYVYYTDEQGNSVIARYRVSADNPDRVDIESGEVILTQSQTTQFHRGGHLAFGPDGYLYIAMGDGGPEGDPEGHGQDLNMLLGKLLRIDVSGERYTVPSDNPFVNTANAKPEIWAYGLRNPWRFSFDRLSGDLYIGDVGQNQWEEIDFKPAGGKGGENYGWSLYEANHSYNNGNVVGNLTMPIVEYSHRQGNSITGGYVYRGDVLPDLDGVYFYADFVTGTIWSLYRDENGVWQNNVFAERTGYMISSFGEDDSGELYIVNYSGSIMRFDPTR